MRKLLLLIFIMLTIVSAGWSATYYISPSGSDTTGDGSYDNPWATIRKAYTEMSGGDTLICKDGTYTGEANQTTIGYYPPWGSSTAWTTIKAEHDGQALFDGEYQRGMWYFTFDNPTDVYIKLQGLVFGRSNVSDSSPCLFYKTRYVQLINCGSFDAGNGNSINFGTGAGSEYFLVEGCYAWGNGRYGFLTGGTQNMVFRNCVSRIDRVDANEPCANFSVYSCTDVVVQNCIAIDTDQESHYFADEYRGGFMTPSTSENGFNNTFSNCIVLNSHIGGISSTATEYYASYDVIFRNCLIWDSKQMNMSSLNSLLGVRTAALNCTIGDCRGDYECMNMWDRVPDGGDNDAVVKNSIIYKYTGGDLAYAMNDVETSDYNSLYANTYNYKATTPGANDHTDIDPIWSVSNTTGALKYPIRVEDGSTLDGLGEDGADIGANIVNQIGVTGTFYGDTGYGSTTTVPVWPFPNEALIKYQFKKYAYTDSTGTITGNRGFAKSDTQLDTDKYLTLTSYVWEYLGNEIPGDVYQSTSVVTASLTRGILGSTVTFNCSLSSGTADVYYWDFGDSSYTVTTTSYTTHCYNSTGTFNVSASADTTAGSANPLITQIDIVQRYTYYISPEGSDSTGDGSYDNPWATLQKGMSSMGGGNILVCKDGTYTGTLNQIDYYNFPSSGSANAWTIIKAEHDNKAIFDGEYVRSMFNCSLIGDNDIKDCRDAYDHPVYWQFEGIIWQNSNVTGGGGPFVQRRRFIKWLRCGNIDAGDGACAAFNVNRCADVLYERCWTMGNGRYQFLVYCSSSSIVRQCIARSDRVKPNEIYAIYSMYSAINCEVQNCIAIDSDQHEHYINVEGYSGSFCNPATDHDGDNINWNSCLALNNNVGGITCSGNNELDACNVTFNNCVLWDINNYWTTNNYIRGQNDVIDHCTFGVFHSTGGQFSFNSYDSSTDTNATMKNTIIYSHTGMLAKAYPGLIYDVEHLDYLSLWLNDTNYSDAPIGTNSITTHNPIWSVTNSSGALKYIVKTEPGSYLGSAGESGSAIGGNCLYMVGELGTMYGEPGYNSTTTIPMWPFPNEAFYKYKMRQYYYVDTVGPVSGNRGFCAAAAQVDTDKARTLTSYVWEYLGNTKPTTIYNSTSTVTSNVSSILVGTTVTFNCALSSGTADVYYWDFGDSSYDVTYTPEATHSYSTDGIYKVSVAADTTAGATDPVYMSMTVGAAIQEGTNAVVGGCSVGNCIWR